VSCIDDVQAGVTARAGFDWFCKAPVRQPAPSATRIPRVARSEEQATMGVFSPPGTRLHALIGDAMLDLPVYLVERLIAHLAAQHAVADPPSSKHPQAAASESPDAR
jgi:hypothetical protein